MQICTIVGEFVCTKLEDLYKKVVNKSCNFTPWHTRLLYKGWHQYVNLHNASWHMLVGERDDDEIIFWWLTWLQLFAAGICIMRWYTIMMYTKTEDLYRLCKGLQMLDKKHQNSFDHYIRLIDLHYCCVISATSVISYYFLTKYD